MYQGQPKSGVPIFNPAEENASEFENIKIVGIIYFLSRAIYQYTFTVVVLPLIYSYLLVQFWFGIFLPGDVKIKRFVLNDKEKSLKEQFLKRFEQMFPNLSFFEEFVIDTMAGL